MWLLFEKIEAIKDELIACQAAWQKRQSIIRTVSDGQASSWSIANDSSASSNSEFQQDDSRWQWIQSIQPYAMKVMIFGAGHVGEAIVRCLLPIGVQITWVDNRDDIFPRDLMDQVKCISTDVPEAEITHFDRSGAILILTHDHQLDLQLSE